MHRQTGSKPVRCLCNAKSSVCRPLALGAASCERMRLLTASHLPSVLFRRTAPLCTPSTPTLCRPKPWVAPRHRSLSGVSSVAAALAWVSVVPAISVLAVITILRVALKAVRPPAPARFDPLGSRAEQGDLGSRGSFLGASQPVLSWRPASDPGWAHPAGSWSWALPAAVCVRPHPVIPAVLQSDEERGSS